MPSNLASDCCYGGSFNTKAALLGIQALLTPVQAPKANAIAERVIGTLRRECLDHFIIINERHLLTVLREYSPHYNGGRPHRALGLDTRRGRLLGQVHRERAGSSPIPYSVAYIMSTSGWSLDLFGRCASDTDEILPPHSAKVV